MKRHFLLLLLLVLLPGCTAQELTPEYQEEWAQGGELWAREYLFGQEGYYAMASLSQETGGFLYQLNYTPYGSQESVPLCPKPNCDHRDLESCGACFSDAVLVKETEDGLYLLTHDQQTRALQLILLRDLTREVIWQRMPQEAGSSDESYSLGTSESDIVVGEDQVILGIRHTHTWMNEARDGYEWEQQYEVALLSLSTGECCSLWSFPYYERDGEFDFIGMLGAWEYQAYLYQTHHGETMDTVIYAVDLRSGEATEAVQLSQKSDYGMVAQNPLRALDGIIYYEEKQGDTWYIGTYDVRDASAALRYPLEDGEEMGGIYYAAGLAMTLMREDDLDVIITDPIDLQTGERVANPDTELLNARLDHGNIYTIDSSRKTNADLPTVEKNP